MLDKKTLRKEIYELNKKNRNVNFINEDKLLIEKLVNKPIFKKADTILLFYPLQNEVNIISLINYCLSLNKTVALPKTFKDIIKFTKIGPNWETQLIKGLYNTVEPNSNLFIEDFNANTLIIVPALAYGKDNSRIGHGKGYYDKFLKSYSNIYKIGLCRKHLLFDKILMNKNDIYLDEIIYIK
ncbi:MAG: 5-formyltetrahydrofolate cyclo-ligase [Pleomorphochaeta sp.]